VAEKEYQRLTSARPRTRFAIVSTGNSSLWLGKDHLLVIDSNGYTETYKRFYFRDIQALLIRKTDGHKYITLVCAVLAFIFFLIAALNQEIVVRYVFGILGGLSLLFIVFNFLLGPTLACHIRTAVQTEELPSFASVDCGRAGRVDPGRNSRAISGIIRPRLRGSRGQPN
jgi:hypothetical protein